MKFKINKTITFAIALFYGMSAASHLQAADMNYEHERGWFFYNEPPVVEPTEKKAPESENRAEKEENRPENEVPEPENLTPPVQAIPAQPTATEQMEMFKKAFEEAQNQAILNPTLENMSHWLAMQKAMLTRSDNFAKVYKQSLATNPDLRIDVPTSTYAANTAREAVNTQKATALKALADVGQIFFFFSSDCPYCHAQVEPLMSVSISYDIDIFPISMDGQGIPGIEDFKPDNGISRRLEVDTWPTIYFVIPKTQTFYLISAGVLTTTEITDRLLVIAEKENLSEKIDIPAHYKIQDEDGQTINDVINAAYGD